MDKVSTNLSSVGNVSLLKNNAESLKDEKTQAVEPKDTFLKTVGNEMKCMALKVGEITSTSVGGAVGIAGMALGLYAGAFGGAAFLGTLGGGIGLVTGAIASKGILGFLGTSFASATLLAKAGIVIGGVSTGAGGFQLAKKVADVVGKVPGMLIGGTVGLVTGTIKGIENSIGGNK